MGLGVAFAGLASSAAAAPIVMKGFLVERGTRKPLAGYSVFVLPQKWKAVTAADGSFTVTGEPVGAFTGIFTWVVNATGYQRLEQNDAAENAAGEHTLYLQRASYQAYETTIVSQEEKRHDTSKSILSEEFLQAPGAGRDPVKAVANLPGINRPLSFSSQVLIQGSGPQDTKYELDGHEIPLVFHFGGLTSVVIPEAIDRVDTLFAGYGPEEGRAIGGVIGLWTKSPAVDRLHGLAFADLYTAGALIEGPIGGGSARGAGTAISSAGRADAGAGGSGTAAAGSLATASNAAPRVPGADGGSEAAVSSGSDTSKPSSFLLSARQSYVGEVLRAAFKHNSDFNLTVAPEFRDGTAIFQTELTPIDDFKTTFHVSEDTLGFLLAEPVKQDPSIRGAFTSKTAFFRLIPQLVHHHGAHTTTRLSFGLGKDWVSFDNAENYFYLQSIALTEKGEIEHEFSNELKSQFGFDNRHRWSNVQLSIPNYYQVGGVGNPISSGTRRMADLNDNQSVVGLYLRNEYTPRGSDFTFLPNLRTDYFSPTRETFFEPRPAIRYRWDESLTLRTSGGLYAQPPQEQEYDKVFGNPDLKAPRAWHLNVGAEKDFRHGHSEGWLVSSDAFLKDLHDLVAPSARLVTRDGVIVPENFNNDSRGQVIGLQTQAKYASPDWSLTVAYTLSRSRLSTSTQTDYPSQYDQTHLLGVIASRELGRNWRFSGRFRYATGNPNTPILGGTLDADNDVYLPSRGSIYSERLESFYQLDARFDKKWIFDKWILSLYLDVQNVTNRKNIERVEYAYDFSSSAETSGLPILPTLGVKGEF